MVTGEAAFLAKLSLAEKHEQKENMSEQAGLYPD
jgi:hypothetical protein